MRFSVLLAALATSIALSSTLLADSQGDLEHCKFIGEISKADEGIAACGRVLDDPKATAQNRAAAFSNRCGWWWAKKDPDRALSDCNEAIRANSGYAAAYLNRGNAYLSKSDFERAFGDFNEAIRLDPKNAWAFAQRGNLYKNKGDFDRALADLNESIRLDNSARGREPEEMVRDGAKRGHSRRRAPGLVETEKGPVTFWKSRNKYSLIVP